MHHQELKCVLTDVCDLLGMALGQLSDDFI